MKKIEILAPAGSFDSVIAAVRSGADAVYLGEKAFSARSSAKNFDDEELKKATAYCHIHGVKVYVTINTIVFDDELEKLKKAIISAAEADVDALIVQNMGVARLAHRLVPDLALHASTQMSIHTASGVKALYEMGFKRVVLAREMSKKEIEKCCEIPVELEVFVHGALCMCVSGQCYLSAMIGARSGNRGSCAQPCRLPFSVNNQKGGHALSLKDNSIVNYLGELQNMGVASAKIEGRMKRPEYVSAAVRACVEQRDFGFISDKTQKMLRGVFSRTGFTDAYYIGKTGSHMFGTRTKSDVVSADEKLFSSIRSSYKDEIGNVEITFDFTAKLGENPVLVVSDGVHTIRKIADTVTEKAINRPIDAEKCRKQLEKTGSTAYNPTNVNINIDDDISIPLSIINSLRRDVLDELDTARSVVHNYKINRPIDAEKCRKQLEKTGSTAYNPTNVNINIDDDISIPLSIINSLRRDVLDELDTARSVVHNYKINRDYEITFPKFTPPVEKSTRARVPQTKLSNAFKKCELVFVPLFADKRELLRLKNEGFSIGVEIPRGMFGREDTIAKKLSEMKEIGISDVLCNNLGALYIAKNLGFTLHSGFGMNFVNTLDLLWAEEYGIKDAELSFELDFKRINALGGNIPRGIISYGYLPLMLCRSCPVKGAGIDCKTCKNHSKMKDRLGKQFLLKCDGNCTEVLNCDLLFVPDKQNLTLLTSFNILRFSVENYVETVESLNESSLYPMLKDKLTYGLYRRGVN